MFLTTLYREKYFDVKYQTLTAKKARLSNADNMENELINIQQFKHNQKMSENSIELLRSGMNEDFNLLSDKELGYVLGGKDNDNVECEKGYLHIPIIGAFCNCKYKKTITPSQPTTGGNTGTGTVAP